MQIHSSATKMENAMETPFHGLGSYGTEDGK